MNVLPDNNNSIDDGDDDYAERYDPDVAAQLRKARQLLDDVAKKNSMKKKEDEEGSEIISSSSTQAVAASSSSSLSASALPFFAARTSSASSTTTNSKKIKSKTQTGSIIADGESMALLSKSEPWEIRSLSQLKFREEATLDYDGNTDEDATNDDGTGKTTSSSLADRDVASSIYNLRKMLRNEDFMKVFDSRNRFIGELD